MNNDLQKNFSSFSFNCHRASAVYLASFNNVKVNPVRNILAFIRSVPRIENVGRFKQKLSPTIENLHHEPVAVIHSSYGKTLVVRVTIGSKNIRDKKIREVTLIKPKVLNNGISANRSRVHNQCY